MRNTLTYFITIALLSTLFGVTATDAVYDLNTNVLEIVFDDNVRTDNVLLGLIDLSDGSETVQVDGGVIETAEVLYDTVRINLIYGTVLDERANNDEETSNTQADFKYWGNTNELANAVEELEISSLMIDIGMGAFVAEDLSASSAVQNLPVNLKNSIIEEDEPHPNSPVLQEAYYNANFNQLTVIFDRDVQFDQLPEDRTCNNGQDDCPGNGIIDGGPPEDGEDVENDEVFGNNNGVLDMEANVDVFKIMLSSTDGMMTLEGFDYIEQTADNDTIDIFLTRSNAKKFELDVFGDDLAITIHQGGFVDTYYNPNQSIQLPLDFIPDSQPLNLVSASYTMEDNELQLDFGTSRNVRYSKPYPVFSKIYVSAGVDTVVFSGIRLSNLSSDATILKFKELLLPDQTALELLIRDAQASGTDMHINIDEYAIYDVENNGNQAGYGKPLFVLEDYDDPEIYPQVDEISYSARFNQIQIDWAPEPDEWVIGDGVSQYFDYKLVQDRSYQEITGIVVNNVTTGEVFDPEFAYLSRNSNKEFTYITLDMDNAGWFETAANAGDSLAINIDPFTFFSAGSSDNNGNHQIDLPIHYINDVTGPVISSVKLDVINRQIIMDFNKNIQAASFNPGTLNLTINDMPYSVDDYTVDIGEGFVDEVVFQLSDTAYEDMTGYIPVGEIIDVQLDLEAGIAQNLDNTGTLDFLDLNENGVLDDDPEPFDDFGIDGLPSELEPGYPGDCSVAGACSDIQWTDEAECIANYSCSDTDYSEQEDCEDNLGTCSNPRHRNRQACENAGATWTPDPDAWVVNEWTPFESQADCENSGAVWTPNLDPNGDDYDAVLNPGGTEMNGSYEEGEPFDDLNNDGVWDLYEFTSIEMTTGRFLWNESHRAFADAPENHFFIQKYVDDEIAIMVEQSVWDGQCYDEEREKAADCTAPNVTYINGRCVYVGVHTQEECDAVAGAGETPIFTQVCEEDVLNLATFYQNNKMQIESVHSGMEDLDEDGRLTIALYDISDEYSKGANDTNSSLFTHGYYTLYEEPAEMINAGDFLFLDVAPQVISGSEDDFLNTLYNAMVHEYTKLLIDQNDPEEEDWLKEGLAFFEQVRLLDNVAFFGDADPGVSSGNQLTYISFSKKDRADQHNIYLFLSYLMEKYVPAGESTSGWDLIDAVAMNDTITGLASIDTALVHAGYPEVTSGDVFIDYAVTCFLDIEHELNYYDGLYTIDAVDLHAPPSSKNAGSLKFSEDSKPPYSLDQVPPWSFNFYFMEGLSVSLIDNSISEKTPLLLPGDDLIVDGYDGVELQAAKIMLKNGFTEHMHPMYEVVYFDMDSLTSRGSLPVTTNSIITENEGVPDTLNFQFKDYDGICSDGVSATQTECCENNSGFWNGSSCEGGLADWTWHGNQNMALVVAKVDNAQPANTYDLVVTNITSAPEYSNFYVMQNPGFQSFLDLYVVSERPIFDAIGVEGPNIEVVGMIGSNGIDTTYALLEPTNLATEEYILYHLAWELGTWENYSLTYSGMDQNGISLPSITYTVSTVYTLGRQGSLFSTGTAELVIPAYRENVRLVAFDIPETGQTGLPELGRGGLEFNSGLTSFASENGMLPAPTAIRMTLDDASNGSTCLYRLTGDTWVNLGGVITENQIQAVTDQLGVFAAVSGSNHLPVTEVELQPGEFLLAPNYPNPFNAQTTLRYFLPEDSPVRLNVYNIRGQWITTLVNEVQPAAWYSLNWNGLDAAGLSVPSGVYFVRFEAGNISETQKMVLLK